MKGCQSTNIFIPSVKDQNHFECNLTQSRSVESTLSVTETFEQEYLYQPKSKWLKT